MESHNIQNTPVYSFENKKIWARVVNVHDGDTITCIIEAFPECFFKYNVRLEGIDTSEITSSDTRLKELAQIGRNQLVAYITNGKKILDNQTKYTRNDIIAIFNDNVYLVLLDCKKMDKYGRIIATVYNNENKNENKNTVSANQTLVDSKLAVMYNGGKKHVELF